ncbi:hypothetical protein VPH35_078284 [Triticum aestivum]
MAPGPQVSRPCQVPCSRAKFLVASAWIRSSSPCPRRREPRHGRPTISSVAPKSHVAGSRSHRPSPRTCCCCLCSSVTRRITSGTTTPASDPKNAVMGAGLVQISNQADVTNAVVEEQEPIQCNPQLPEGPSAVLAGSDVDKREVGLSSTRGRAIDPPLLGPDFETVRSQEPTQVVSMLPRVDKSVLLAAATDKDKAAERDPLVHAPSACIGAHSCMMGQDAIS